MKKLFNIFGLALVLLTATACPDMGTERMIVPDEDEQTFIADKVYYELVADCLKVVENADIFDMYQAVRSNREEAVALVGKYITFRELYYDKMTGDFGDIVFCEEPGYIYECSFHHYMMGMMMTPKYLVSKTADHHFKVIGVTSKDPAGLRYDCDFTGYTEEGRIHIGGLKITYYHPYDKYSLRITMLEGSQLISPMPDPEKGHKYYPSSGSITIEYVPQVKPYVFYSGYSISKGYKLKLSFEDKFFTVEDEDGFCKRLPSSPSRPPYTVDY